jgi:hypothetical protein
VYAPPFRDEKIRHAKKKLDFTVGAAFSDCKEKTLGAASFRAAAAARRRNFLLHSLVAPVE